jgi:hypothetical protein
MPRNVSGTYSLPLPPVVPNTTIATTWANPTLDDIAAALTDSLSRSGNGGMSAPFLLVDGTEAAPALAFSSSPGSGIWLDVDSLNFSYQGVSKLEIGAGSIKGNVRFTTVDGTVAAPAYSFTSDTDTGITRVSAASALGFVVDGAMRGAFKNVPGLHLGNETTDPSSSSVAVYNRQRLVSTLNTQYGLLEQTMFSTSDTATANGVYVDSRFADGAYVTNTYHGLRITPPTPGAGHSIGSVRAILIDDMSGTGSGYGVFLGMNNATNKWALYSNGTAKSYHLGQLGIGVEPESGPQLQVRKLTPAASPAWQAIDTVVLQQPTNNILQLHAGATGGTLGIGFSVGLSRGIGAINYATSSNIFTFSANSTAVFQLTPTSVKPLVTLDLSTTGDITGPVTVAGGLTTTGFLSALTSVSAATSVSAGTFVDANTEHRTAGTRVVSTRKTGWTAATGTATRTTFATASVTLPVLAEHVKALLDDLIAHGLIGA